MRLSGYQKLLHNKENQMTIQGKTIPRFDNEEEERIFWESHDSTEYLDWSQAKQIRLEAVCRSQSKQVKNEPPEHPWTDVSDTEGWK